MSKENKKELTQEQLEKIAGGRSVAATLSSSTATRSSRTVTPPPTPTHAGRARVSHYTSSSTA